MRYSTAAVLAKVDGACRFDDRPDQGKERSSSLGAEARVHAGARRVPGVSWSCWLCVKQWNLTVHRHVPVLSACVQGHFGYRCRAWALGRDCAAGACACHWDVRGGMLAG